MAGELLNANPDRAPNAKGGGPFDSGYGGGMEKLLMHCGGCINRSLFNQRFNRLDNSYFRRLFETTIIKFPFIW